MTNLVSTFLMLAWLQSHLVVVTPWIRRRTRCFDDPPIGCFTTNPPFHNVLFLPHSPSYIDLRYKHFIHNDNATYHWRDATSFAKTRFRPDLKTVLIVHGYIEYGDKPWVNKMVSELTRLDEPINVVVVDWRRGARALSLGRAIANGRVVAAMGALLLKEFIALGASPSSFHIIGNSLGAHVAGDLASRVPGTGRVTGLDPSRRLVIGYGPQVGLDATDAVVVDVIHTDSDSRYGYGSVVPQGTVDFYANGGLTQPGCGDGWWDIVLDLLWIYHEKCSHSRAIKLFTESISTCTTRAGLCSNLDDITGKRCRGCVPGKTCATFGYHLEADVPGTYAFETGDKSPFC